MAVITPDGYSYDTLDLGYTDQERTFGISHMIEVGYTPTTETKLISDTLPEINYSSPELTIPLLQIWQNPLFINAHCPAVGPTRPTTGQVYPRGYS